MITRHLLFLGLLIVSNIFLPLRAQVVNDGETATLSNVTTNITGTVTVGTNGAFTLLVLSDNALLTNSTHGVISANASARSNEVRLISPSASWLMGGTLFVGSNGAFSTLVVSNGAVVRANAGFIGRQTSSGSNVVLVTGTGSMWSNVAGGVGLTVGNGSGNQLIVSNGGWVVNANASGTIGGNGSNNLVRVTGPGSVWSNRFALDIKSIGAGNVNNRLVVEDGGQVFNADGSIDGLNGGGNNFALVTGSGAVWNNSVDLYIGPNARAALVASNGGTVLSVNGYVGQNSNQVWITDSGSRWSNQNDVVLHRGNTLTVTNGGWLINSNGYVGGFTPAALSSSNNTVVVTGAGSTWSNRADLFVGFAGPRNHLVVSNGATVTASNVFLGFQSSSLDNRLIVDGGTLRASRLTLRNGSSNFLNAGVIEADRLVVDTLARLTFKGGTLAAGSITIVSGSAFDIGDGVSAATLHLTGNDTHDFPSTLVVRPNATLRGNGFIQAPINLQSGGTLSPGSAAGEIGRLISITGSSPLAGTVNLEIGKNGATLANDQVGIASTLTFVNATVLVTNIGPTALAAGDRFQLFTAFSFAGTIQTLLLPPLAPGLGWITNLLVDGSIEVESLAPSVQTLPASALIPMSATLNGMANPKSFATIVWFEYGLTTNYGNVTAPQPLGSGSSPANFSQVLTGLLAGATYHFRAAGSNSFGAAFGADETFQTFGALVTTLPPSAVAPTTATLNGLVNPRGTNTSGWFEWGRTTNYGSRTPPRSVGSNNVATNFSANISGLIPQTVFHFRAVASNALGIAVGADQRSPRFDEPDYFKASNTGIQDNFGTAVAMSGDTLVVGASGESSNASGVNGDQNNNSLNGAGAVYVFVRNGDSWSQQAYLKASNPGANDSFGQSVAISGDTIAVGAPSEDSNATGINGNQSDNSVGGAGAAYVFVRTGINWSQQAYLKAADAVGVCTTVGCTGCGCFPGDFFGTSVAVSGDTVVVGAPFDDSNATGVNGNAADNSAMDSGAAYVFVRSGTNWTQQAYLKASNAEGAPMTNFLGDGFGISVAMSSNTVVVGATREDSNATGVNGNQNNNTATDSGAAYVFVRNGTTWTQQSYLKASNAQFDDQFGNAVAISGDAIVVGAMREDSTATGVNGDASNNQIRDAGAAYVFQRNGANWTQSAYLKASNTDRTEESEFFGISVAISGNLIVVGARNEDSGATGVNGDGRFNTEVNAGAAYAYEFNGTTWAFLAYLKASNTEGLPAPFIGDNFGQAVATADGFVAAGAPFESSSATGINGDQDNNDATFSGAVYVFRPTPPPAPEINVSESNAAIANGGSSPLFAIVGTNTTTRTFVIHNSGNDFLTGLTITLDDPDAASFAIVTNPVSPVFPTSNTTFTVRFTPTHPGTNTATLRIASNDTDENPFTIALKGVPLSFNVDGDGDGLNDASEFLMSSLGFNFQSSQTTLVNTLFNNANGAGLFTQTQLQALNVNSPLLTRDPFTGLFKLTIGVEKATLLTNFFPFPMTAPQTSINAEGKLEFQFNSPDNAAFFRLEAR